jgi:hypothetical protein
MKKLFSLLFILVLFSCNRSNPALKYALEAAGKNRPELEKVLTHYKGDSLKYQAAVFLIENMPGHSSYKGDDILDYYEIGKVLFKSGLTPPQQSDSLLEKHLASWAGMCPGNNESAGKKKVDALTMATNT